MPSKIKQLLSNEKKPMSEESSDDEVKEAKTKVNKKKKDKGGKPSSKKDAQKKGKPKGGKGKHHPQGDQDTPAKPPGLVPIATSGYQALPLKNVPDDMHIVTIDSFTVACQLFEQCSAELAHSSNVDTINARIDAFKASIYGLIMQIILGVRFSDIPSLIIDSFSKHEIYVREKDLDLLHGCCIPTGRVFINRANKSIAFLAALIREIPDKVSNFKEFERAANVLLATKGIGSFVLLPEEGEDLELAKSLKTEYNSSVTTDYVLNELRRLGRKLNAIHSTNEGFVKFVPMLTQLSEVSYLQNNGSNITLITFQKITDPDVRKRHILAASTIRFFIGFRRCVRDPSMLVESDELVEVIDDSKRCHVLDKYGLMSIEARKRTNPSFMDEEEISEFVPPSGHEFPRPVIRKPGAEFCINEVHPARLMLKRYQACITRAELANETDMVSMCFGSYAGTVIWKVKSGEVRCSLLIAAREPGVHGTNVVFSRLTGAYSGEVFSSWVEIGPSLSIRDAINMLPKTDEEARFTATSASP